MTNEQAIDYFYRQMELGKIKNDTEQEVFELAIDSLGKQIAIRPKDKDVRIDGTKVGMCKCKHFMTMIDLHCSKCGQKLDWSDNND